MSYFHTPHQTLQAPASVAHWTSGKRKATRHGQHGQAMSLDVALQKVSSVLARRDAGRNARRVLASSAMSLLSRIHA